MKIEEIKRLKKEIENQAYNLFDCIDWNEYICKNYDSESSEFDFHFLAYDFKNCKYDEEWFDVVIKLLQEMKENVLKIKRLEADGNN